MEKRFYKKGWFIGLVIAVLAFTALGVGNYILSLDPTDDKGIELVVTEEFGIDDGTYADIDHVVAYGFKYEPKNPEEAFVDEDIESDNLKDVSDYVLTEQTRELTSKDGEETETLYMMVNPLFDEAEIKTYFLISEEEVDGKVNAELHELTVDEFIEFLREAEQITSPEVRMTGTVTEFSY